MVENPPIFERLTASGGYVSYSVPPTTLSPAPTANNISVLHGDRDTMRIGVFSIVTVYPKLSVTLMGYASVFGINNAVTIIMNRMIWDVFSISNSSGIIWIFHI